jgi:hypothetical protein
MANLIKMLLPLDVYEDNKYRFSQKRFVFSQFHFIKRRRLCENLRNCTANYVLCFLNQKTKIKANFANVLWVAFLILSGSLSLMKYPVYYDLHQFHKKKRNCENQFLLGRDYFTLHITISFWKLVQKCYRCVNVSAFYLPTSNYFR